MKPIVLAVAAALLAAPALAQQAATVSQRTANDGQVVMSGIPEIPDSIGERFLPYQNVRTAAFLDWTADGEAVYIATRFGNIPQVHRVDEPGGARQQVTFQQEPVDNALRRPGSDQFLFAMDEGGGEFDQLFLHDPATGRARQLTEGRARNSAPVWSPDGKRIVFTSTRRDGRSNDVWMMEVDDPASARLAFEAPDGTLWLATDWSPDGKQLLILNYVSITDSRIHLFDLESFRSRMIAGGPEGRPGSYSGVYPRFDAGSEGVFLATDALGEYLELVHLVLATGEWHRLSGDLEWNVENFVMSEDRRRGAFSVNEGGVSRVYLMDLARGDVQPATGIPQGAIAGMGFSPDGRRLALTLVTSVSPADVYALELGDSPTRAGELTRWTESEVGGLNADTFVDAELIEYASFDGLRVPAFVQKPRGPGPHPVVIVIHGGPEDQSRPVWSSVLQGWVNELGIAVIQPNVRGSTGYGKTYVGLDNAMLRENSVRDIGALLDYVRDQPDLDASRVMVYGGSYGGYMVLASMIHYGDRLRGGVDIVGISDWITFLQNTEEYRRDLRRAEYGDERDPEVRAFFERISPKRQAARIRAPLFVIQGQNDPRVPVTESEQIVEEVRRNGRPVWYMKALNEGHGFVRKENVDLMRNAVVLFFQEHLLPPT